MRLTDKKLAEIREACIRKDGVPFAWEEAAVASLGYLPLLLADREALLDRLEYNVSQNTSLVQELAGLKAENVKLRKVVEAAENALLYARDLRNPYEADQLKRALDAIDTKDATDDKG